MTVLLRLFISLFPLFLFSYTIHLSSDVNLYSDKLYFDIFEDKWKSIPSTEPMNRALDFSKLCINFTNKNFNFGVGYFSEGILKLNKGFIETWYYASNNFYTLLKKKDIGYYISEPNIYGILNYSQFQFLCFFKKFKNFRLNLGLIRGKVIQYMKVEGLNEKNHFLADLYYYYSNKNILMDNYLKSNNYKGYGYSLSLEFKKIFLDYYVKLNFINLLGNIYWKNIILMKYHFDSNTEYIGNDGYYHYRPFGIGKFIKTDFVQKLPFIIKYKISKRYKKFIVGDEGMYSNGIRFDILFIKKKFFKFGWVPQTKNYIIGLFFKNVSFEVSNNLDNHSKFFKFNLNVKKEF